ncbi:pseudouridine synthase [Boletus edulis]|nr:pseudouridine synthase [Boletus edulis]
MSPNYDTWSRQDLIARLTDLEQRAKGSPHHHPRPKRAISPGTGRPFHFKDHPVRKIAVKFCYSGWEYNGLAYQIDPTPVTDCRRSTLPSICENKIGVSAAGQVVSLWVRSALPVDSTKPPSEPNVELASDLAPSPTAALDAMPDTDSDLPSFDLDDDPPSNSSVPPPRTQELHYVSILNRILPPTIRVLAWSPVSPDFSASTQLPTPTLQILFSPHTDLDITLMQRAATTLLTQFRRRIIQADIALVSSQQQPGKDDDDAVYVLDLVGSAFLYHQVRHIMAVLFLVGAGLEHPSIVPTLMNVDGSERPLSQSDPPLPIVDRKPDYQMADALPLMLWECAFADSDVRWQTGEDHTGSGDGPHVRVKGDLYHQLHAVHQRSLVHTTLEAHFLAATARYHPPPPQYFPFSKTGLTMSTIPLLANKEPPVLGVPLGGGTYRRGVKYIPILLRKRLDHVEVANARWRTGKGSRRVERVDAAKNGTINDE